MKMNTEALVIFMEECGECIQEASKMIRFNGTSTFLEKEICDVLCLIKILEDEGIISMDNMEANINMKREKLKEYSQLLLKS